MSDVFVARVGGMMPKRCEDKRATTLRRIVSHFRHNVPRDADSASEMLRALSLRESDLQNWAQPQHDSAASYGRFPLHDESGLEIMVATWNPGDISAIHNHGHLQWGVVQVFGQVEHATFDISDGTIRTANRELVDAGSMIGVVNSTYHQMGQADTRSFLTLHVYGNQLQEHGVTHDAQIIDLLRNRIYCTDGGVFYDLDRSGETNYARAPRAQPVEIMRDCINMCDRYTTRAAAAPGDPSMQAYVRELAATTYDSGNARQFFIRLQAMHPGRSDLSTDLRETLWTLIAAANNQRRLSQSGVIDTLANTDLKSGEIAVTLTDQGLRVSTKLTYVEQCERLMNATTAILHSGNQVAPEDANSEVSPEDAATIRWST